MKDCICNLIFDNMKHFNCIHTHTKICDNYRNSLLGKVVLGKEKKKKEHLSFNSA